MKEEISGFVNKVIQNLVICTIYWNDKTGKCVQDQKILPLHLFSWKPKEYDTFNILFHIKDGYVEIKEIICTNEDDNTPSEITNVKEMTSDEVYRYIDKVMDEIKEEKLGKNGS